MRLTWARERPTHVAHLIALDTMSTWMESEGRGTPPGEKIEAALRQLGWRPPPKDTSIPPRYKTGYVGLCSIAFDPQKIDCVDRRCKLCLAQLAEIAAAAGVGA